MRRGFGVVLAAAFFSVSSPAAAQMCLHDTNEPRGQMDRRQAALTAVRSLNAAEQMARLARGSYQPLLSLSPFLAPHRSDGGQLGDVVRQMRFDRDEILPGWRARLLVDGEAYVLTLEDTDDPCGFAYTSDATGMVRQGYPVGRVVALPRPQP
jgi:hypothetical protein